MVKLLSKAAVSLFGLILVMVMLLFGPQESLGGYWQAWLFLSVYVALSIAIVVWLAVRDPKLAERRMRGGPLAEKQPTQKIIMWITTAGFVAMFLVAGLDHRLGWSRMPAIVAVIGDLLVATGWWAIWRVFRENSFASATVELSSDQKVISTGPYASIRHPMYAGGLVMFAGIPIALGSWWAVLILLALLPFLARRMFDEEQFLAANLTGYAAYMEKVRYRLIPRVW
jgi:protein-S-isoprenylcysteine O-methyltransferase Ste14